MELVGEGAAYDGSVLCAGSQAQAQAAGVSQISLSPMGVASGGSWALLGAAAIGVVAAAVERWSSRGVRRERMLVEASQHRPPAR